ncbi:MAG: type II secretion system protein GspL [Pseudomonadota bacterium]
MSTLYIRLPSKAAAESAEHWIRLPSPYAWVSGNGAIEREGVAPLVDLAEPVAKAQRVFLLMAASDVSLLRVRVPPMSAARLRAALPNMVEDQLVSDPAECVVVDGGSSEGLRTVAVVQRAWLEIIIQTFRTYGARHLAALPAQLCLPYKTDLVSAAITEHGIDIDLSLRLSEQDGIGLPIMPEQPEFAPHEVIEAIIAVVPHAPVMLYVPLQAVPAYQQVCKETNSADQRITVVADEWPHWIAGARSVALDLTAGLGAASRPGLNWRPWRWPLALAALVLVVNIVGLNIEWWRLKNDAAALRANMTQVYKTAYPNETVIRDPVAQLRQKIATARRVSGQSAPDDFTALTAAFAEAWASSGQASPAGIAGLEYRDRSLFVRLKPDAQAPVEQVKAALAGRGLSLVPAASQSAGVVWQIRSGK